MAVRVAPSRSVVVKLPAGKQFDIKQASAILTDVLGRCGCLACFSGFDINFVNEVQLGVDEAGALTSVEVAATGD